MQHILFRLQELISLAEKLKTEERHCWYSNGRRESVAEHVWRMSLMAMVIAPHLHQRVNMEKLLKIVIIHDLVEAVVGDTPFFEAESKEGKALKQAKERMAINKIKEMIGPPSGDEIFQLWYEYETASTHEARVAKALDKLEANIQHNTSPIETWTEKDQERAYGIDRYCTFDPLLQELCNWAKDESTSKMEQAGIDTNAVKERASANQLLKV